MPRSTTARDLRQSIGSTPVLSVCAELEFGPGGVKPCVAPTSIAKRIEDELDAPVVAGLHSLAAANLADAPPDEDALVCGDDARGEGARARARRPARLRQGGRLRAARERPCARGDDRRDRERQQALQGPRGPAHLRHPVTGGGGSTEPPGAEMSALPTSERGSEIRVIPLAGHPGDRGRRRPRGAAPGRGRAGGRLRGRGRARRRPEGGLEGGGPRRAAGRRRAVAASARARRRPRSPARRVDPARERPRRPRAAAADHRRDEARLRLRLGRRRRLEREGGGDARSCSRSIPMPRLPGSGRRSASGRAATSA